MTENQKLGRQGEQWFFEKSDMRYNSKWINKDYETGYDYDGLIDKLKVDVKTTKASSYTFNCLWSNHKKYFNKNITYVFVFKDIKENSFKIDFMYKGSDLAMYRQIRPSTKGKKNTCFIFRKEKQI